MTRILAHAFLPAAIVAAAIAAGCKPNGAPIAAAAPAPGKSAATAEQPQVVPPQPVATPFPIGTAVQEPQVAEPPASDRPAPPRPTKTLEELANAAKASEFKLPPLEEGKIAAAGIRKLAGRHLTLYTDLPAAAEIDELPAVFDAAVPLWAEYFAVPAERLAGWQLVGSVMKDKDRFAGAGLYPPRLPDFPHGYSQGSQLWLYDQPSGYYRRHLMLHEGTHCFMHRWLGGAGPPWYMEGIAELLATHRWAGGRLVLGVMPASKEELPYWGRVKIVKDEVAEGRGLSLQQIMLYDAHAHLRQEPYGWCWAAAAFLDQHPQTQTAFRDLKARVADRTLDFSQRFADRLKPQWPAISQDWAIFVRDCDYGYDFARAAAVHRPSAPLPAGGATATVDAARGWQSSGITVEAGKTYTIAASGRFEVAQQPRPWPCEAGGVTIRYHAGRPLGLLLASVDLGESQPVGAGTTITPAAGGTLYFKINEAASGLADNRGGLMVTIRE